jgi:hypothetical protein
MRAFVVVVCLLSLFRLLATISTLFNVPPVYRPHPESTRVLTIRGAIFLILFVWGSWALWARA